MVEHRPADARDMGIGLGQAGAIERDPRQVAKAMFGKVEVRMLAGADDQAFMPARDKRGGDRRELDGFGTSADDKPDFSATQPSPYLGRGNVPPLWMNRKPSESCRNRPGS